MRNFINIVENADLQSFVTLAQKHDTVEKFIRATDGMDVLYRGHSDEVVPNNCFMTDYVGHAANYSDDGNGRIDAFAYDHRDVLYYDDDRFDEMRNAYRRLSNQQLATIYREALAGNRHSNEFSNSLRMVVTVIRGEMPYSKICGIPRRNDVMIPLMQKYARDAHGKNIIAFHGNDYAEYGGQTEFVVGDVSKLVDLRKLYATL
jgi:hypothetical protein